MSAEALTAPSRASLRGVVWDIDGTLADSFNLAFGATNRVLERNGVAPVDGQAYIDGCRFTTPVRLAQHAGFDAAVDSQRAAALAAEFDADYIALVTIEAAPLFPGVRDLLRDLARHPSIKSGCLTNAAVGYAEAVVKVHSLEDFVSVHGADDVPRAKPFADGLIVCASDLQLDPAECFYVGDSVTDGQAARAAEYGLAIGVCWDAAPTPAKLALLAENFDVVVTTVPDLRKILFRGK